MASYQARQRDPLLDRGTQAMLERRGRELLGLAFLVLAFVFAALLISYSPDDPGWMVATDEPVRNVMGGFGAAVASTLLVIGGLGAWGIPVFFLAWGLRFVLHRGEERSLHRMVFAVIALAMASVFAATHVPGPDWPHPAIGLGGLFGDTVLGALLNVLPLSAGLGLKVLSLGFGAALLAMSLFVTGFDRAEVRAIGMFLRNGLIRVYIGLVALTGQGLYGAGQAAAGFRARQADRRAAAVVAQKAQPVVARTATPSRIAAAISSVRGAAVAEAEDFGHPAALRPAPLRAERPRAAAHVEAEHDVAPHRAGILQGLMRRVAPPAEPVHARAEPELVGDERIRARIADAIKSRVRPSPLSLSPIQAAIARREPPVARAAAPVAAPRPMPRPAAPPRVSAHAFAPEALPADVLDADLHEDDEAWADDTVWDEPAYTRNPAPTPEARRIVQPAPRKAATPSRQAQAEAQPRLAFDDKATDYELPPLALLSSPATIQRYSLAEEALEENARMLENVLDDYGVKGEIVSVRPGPVVTMYELEPAPGLKASRVIGLADDIARSMSALSARVSTVPGRTVIGIELPNIQREKVVLREILSARDFGDSNLRLPLALGKDIGGEPIIANLAKMPHLLIAGTTGSGKSVAINTMILSLLYKLSPEECRLIMIDPKMLELSVYDGIPHLLSPVVTDPKKAVVALKWVVAEMEERYRRMSKMGVRNIEGYNGRVREAQAKSEMFKRTIQTGFDDDTGDPVFETEEFQPVTIPYIVVVVDEMADLMMVAGKEIEACIQRLAQMARASGIHLIMATQRPSVDVITGTIKANFPTRISFQVTSKIDSRTILGEQGAEQLLGMGDMLYMAGGAKITRIHGPFVSDEEVEEIVNHLKSFGPPQYMSGVVEGPDEDKEADIDLVLGLGGDSSDDSLYDQAVAIVAKDRKCSTSYIQRKLGIGYNKAAKLVEQMEEQGVVTRANHVGKREILVEER